MLEDLGCEVVTAASGQEGIDTLVADERIDVLITDVNMPGMDGYESVLRVGLERTRDTEALLNPQPTQT
jgi:two-component system, cell cycle response regulator CpdR